MISRANEGRLEPAILARGLTRRFRGVPALAGIDLEVPAGGALGLVGPNGAGKSTAVRLLCGLLRPHGGTMRVAGVDPVAEGRRLRQRIGAVPDFPTLFDVLTARENLLRIARLRRLPREEAARRIDELGAALRLGAALDRPAGALSQGERKKAALAAALLHAPRVLFLDEPFEGIDPPSARTIRRLLGALRERGVTLLVTSHVMPLVESIASHVTILDEGRVAAAGELPAVLAGHRDLEEAVLAAAGAPDPPPSLSWYEPA